jgi:hypothetical protein
MVGPESRQPFEPTDLPIDKVRAWEIWDDRVPLNQRQITVWLALESFGRRIFPRQKVLAARARMSLRAVSKTVRELRDLGFIVTTSRGKALRYTLLIPEQYRNRTKAQHAQEKCAPCTSPAHQVRTDLKSVNEPPHLTSKRRIRHTRTGGPSSAVRRIVGESMRRMDANYRLGTSDDPLRSELERRGLSKQQSAVMAIRMAELHARSGCADMPSPSALLKMALPPSSRAEAIGWESRDPSQADSETHARRPNLADTSWPDAASSNDPDEEDELDDDDAGREGEA